MKVMIGRDERGRALVKTVDGLNLQDLSAASDDQIRAVTSLVWEIKGLFYALIKGKASDVLGNFDIGGGAKLSATLVADLTASIPRDVVMSAQQQWLPNLAAEMANGRIPRDQPQSGWTALTTEPTSAISAPAEKPTGQDEPQETPAVSPQASDSEAASVPKRDPPPCVVHLFGQCLVSARAPDGESGRRRQPDAKQERQEASAARRRSAWSDASWCQGRRAGSGAGKRRPEKPVPRRQAA